MRMLCLTRELHPPAPWLTETRYGFDMGSLRVTANDDRSAKTGDVRVPVNQRARNAPVLNGDPR